MLKLYLHPLSSFCWKVLVAFYENDTAFEPVIVDLANEPERNNFRKVWAFAQFPVLRDEARGLTIPESTTIIEYLDRYYPGRTRFIPTDPDHARTVRALDRFYDLHVQVPMQKIVTDRIRPPGQNDAFGAEQARAHLETAYAVIEAQAIAGSKELNDNFSLADCAAAPALFYADLVLPLQGRCEKGRQHLAQLRTRPSFARVLKEAEPYFGNFPR
jgi:glutathione S-transferase